MYPILFTIPIPAIPGILPNGATIPVFSYGTLIALGFFSAYLYTSWLARRRGLDEEDITDIFLVIILSSILGARTNYVISHWQQYASDPLSVFRVWEGGMVYLGGYLGAMVGAIVYLRYRGLAMGPYFDLFGPAVPFAAALGRLGCVLNGCCYGTPTSLPWAISFPTRGGWSEPRHPTQIYEMILLVTIAIVLHVYYQRNRVPGMVMVGYGYLYSIERFAIEFIRGESEHESYLFGTTLAQTTSIFVVLLTAAYHVYLARNVPPGPLPSEFLKLSADAAEAKKPEVHG